MLGSAKSSGANSMRSSRTFTVCGMPQPLGRGLRLFYSSSACMYPAHNQEDPTIRHAPKDLRLSRGARQRIWLGESCLANGSTPPIVGNYGVATFIARYHNIFGPEGTWTGGREKAPAAICRKIATARNGDEIEIWGDGEQTRSFLYIDECVEGSTRLLRSAFAGPVNIGSEESVTINHLVDLVADIAGKKVGKRHIDGPQGVRGRNSDNRLIREKLGWAPGRDLRSGLEETYPGSRRRCTRLMRCLPPQVPSGRHDRRRRATRRRALSPIGGFSGWRPIRGRATPW